MDPFVTALATGAILVALLARDARSVIYISIGALNFAVTYAYAVADLPHPVVLNGIMDSMMCLVVYRIGRYRWELALYRVYQCAVLISILRLAGVVPDQTSYAIALEVTNWAALLVIGGGAVARMIGEGDGGRRPASPLGMLRRALCALRQESRQTHWWAR